MPLRFTADNQYIGDPDALVGAIRDLLSSDSTIANAAAHDLSNLSRALTKSPEIGNAIKTACGNLKAELPFFIKTLLGKYRDLTTKQIQICGSIMAGGFDA